MDCSQSTLKLILSFAYEGKCDLNTENLVEVLSEADFFSMIDLVDICQQNLLDWISEKNCVEYYLVAYF